MNARLHHRLHAEESILGPYIFGRRLEYLNTVSETTLENSSANNLGLKVLNTCFRRQAKECCTFRETQLPMDQSGLRRDMRRLIFGWLAQSFPSVVRRYVLGRIYISLQTITSWKLLLHLNCKVRLGSAIIDPSFASQLKQNGNSTTKNLLVIYQQHCRKNKALGGKFLPI